MVFQCSGDSACNTGQIAQITVTIDGVQYVVSTQAPACVTQSSTTPNGKTCFHIWTGSYNSEGNQVINYEDFFCADSAEIVPAYPNASSPFIFEINGEPWWQFLSDVGRNANFNIGSVDGVTYFAGREPGLGVAPLSPQYGGGSCASCVPGCTVTIQDPVGAQIYQKSGSDCNYQYDCNGCGPGCLKCTSTNYPGYCCIPCAQIQAQLQSLISARSMRG